ncbi:hypothetical protein AcW1_003025 [Taiwanofungus camphoratus]|nr:hypothetical protein AcV5_001790 [Antrodia cinnamomea]KAI0925277.1 hypothetical protein AcV7_005558 [Antrodia cinnamomea]KAI0942380.1 hypothetical protein AcW1_003025 [Antrodia cinnamomea]
MSAVTFLWSQQVVSHSSGVDSPHRAWISQSHRMATLHGAYTGSRSQEYGLFFVLVNVGVQKLNSLDPLVSTLEPPQQRLHKAWCYWDGTYRSSRCNRCL